jgi:hypothetical protein
MANPRSTFWWLSSIVKTRCVARLGSLAIGLTLCSTAFGAVELLLERDTDIAGQTDLFLISYADQNSFLTNTGLVQSNLPQPIAAGFSAGGLTVDALGGWHLLLERDTDIAGQTDLFLISYPDQNSFLTNTGLVQSNLPQPIAAGFSAGGLHFTIDAEPPNPAPEPGTFALLSLGFAGLALMRRRKQ